MKHSLLRRSSANNALMQKMSSRTHFVNIMSQQVNIAAIFNFCYFSTLSEAHVLLLKQKNCYFTERSNINRAKTISPGVCFSTDNYYGSFDRLQVVKWWK
jgi:hypothetical protein